MALVSSSLELTSKNKYYLHYDQGGSLRAISDNNQIIIKKIVYNSFGNMKTYKSSIELTAGLYDEDTKLLIFGYKYYNS